MAWPKGKKREKAKTIQEILSRQVVNKSARQMIPKNIRLGDIIECCGQTFILNTPKGNRCAVCNTRYYPDDSPYKPQ